MSRKLTVNIEVIDPRVGDNFGFKVSNDGQYLTFTQSGLPDSIGWDKTYVGSGGTTSVVQVNRFLQLDSDLNIMATQSYGGVTNGSIACVLAPSSIVPSNSVAFVGNFTQWTRDNVNIITSNRIISVQPTSYTNYGSGFDFYAGKIVEDNTGAANYIAGSFNNYKGYVTNNFVKTNAVGAISTTFRDNMMSNPNASQRGFNSQVKAVAVQIDGKVLCGGWFTNFNGNARNRIVRLSSLGQLDSTFNVGTGFDSDVNDFAIQSDGKIICVGAFTKYFTTTTTKNRIVRVSNLGAIDTGFTTTGLFGGPGDVIECVKLQSDGKILVGGFFTNKIARLLTGGGIDPSFTVGTGFAYSLGNARVFTIEVLTTGKIVVGGTFDSYNGNPCGHIVMLNSDGTFYKSLTLNYGIMDFGAGVVRSIKRDSANNLYVGGNFTNYLVSTVYVATGDLYSIPIGEPQAISYGTGFNTTSGTTIPVSYGTGFDQTVNVSYLNNDGSILSVGSFNSYNGNSSVKIARISATGSFDSSFVTGTGFNLNVNRAMRFPDEKYLVTGQFTDYNGTTANRVIKLNSDGSVDTSFVSGAGFNSNINNSLVDSNGRIIIEGNFTNYDGNSINRLIRLSATGSYDASFNVGTGLNTGSSTIANHMLLASGDSIYLCGDFTVYNGTTVNRLTKITSTGAIDSSFVTGTCFNNIVNTITYDNSGNIMASGTFTGYNGTSVNRIARISATGSFDSTFISGTGLNGAANCILVNPDNTMLVGGGFTNYNGNAVNRIIKLNYNGSVDSSFVVGTGFNSTVNNIIKDSYGNYLVSGAFTTYNGTTVGRVVALSPTGSIVTSISTPSLVNKMSIHKNQLGDLVAVGNYSTYNATASNKIVKFKYDGSLVTAVGSGSSNGIENPITEKFVMKSDGSMVVFADKYEGTNAVGKVIGIKNDMTVDTSFVSQGFTGNPTITDVAVLPDDSFILVGTDLAYGTASAGPNEYITGVKISATGSLLHTYKLTFPGINYDYRFKTVDVCPLTNRIAFGGRFANDMYDYGGEYRTNLVVTDSNGVLDTTFGSITQTSGSVLDADVNKLKWNDDGRLLAIGTFSRYLIGGSSSTVVKNMVRLNVDGSLDPQVTSNVTTGFNGITNDIKFINKFNTTLGISEIKTIIYGEFTSFNGVNTPHILRLNSDGSLDTTFNTGPGLNAAVDSLVNIDDNLICVGEFTTFNGVTIPSNRILMLNDSGLITATVSGLYDTVQKTYDNLSEFNNGYGVTYSIIDNIVRMEYEFDDDEIVVQDLFDVPDHVELSYTNESININERINEIVTRSDHKIQTQETGTFSYTNFKIRIYEGSLFSGVTASPVKYNITKPKIVSTQTNVYIDVSNLIKEDFEWNIGYFYSNDITNAADLPENISKWVYIEEANYLGTASVSLEKHYLYAIDGYLLNNEIQHLPNLLVNGSKRYVHRDQQQRIYFQTNFLTGIQIIPEVGFSYTPSFDVNTSLNNTSYVQSLSIDKPADARYIDYIFTYADSVETVRYYFYGEFGNCGKEYQELIFKNKWGVLESLAVAKKSKTNLNSIGEDYTRSIVDYNGNYDVTRHTNRKFDVDMEESFILNTDVLPEYMTDSIIDLYASDEVWLKNDNGYTPVVVDGSVNDLKRRIDGPISYNIKVNASHRKIKNIL